MAGTVGSSTDPWGDRLISIFWRKPAANLGERTRRRVALHLIPYLFFLYVLAYLDRINISVAALKLGAPTNAGGLNFDSDVIGFGIGIFFWGYLILEMPSTLTVEKRGARWVFVRILVLWGLCAALLGAIDTGPMNAAFRWLPQLSGDWGPLAGVPRLVNGLKSGQPEYQFYFLRFMLGFFEGGFFPSVILYLSHWFRTEDRAKAVACFVAAIPLTSVIGYPLSDWILHHIEWFGWPGWRWILILEGVLPILMGVVTMFVLPNRPRDARWLAPEERDWLVGELDREQTKKAKVGHGAWVHQFGAVVLLTVVYFCQNVTAYGLNSFMPTIMQSQLVQMPPSVHQWLRVADYAAWRPLEQESRTLHKLLVPPELENTAGNKSDASADEGSRSQMASAAIAGSIGSINPEAMTRLRSVEEQMAERAAAPDFKDQQERLERWSTSLAMLPYLMGFIAILINGRHSDRSGERIWHSAVPLAVSSIGILLAALLHANPLVPVLILIFVVGTCVYAHLPAFWPIPTMFLGATAAASAIGFINMLGNLGGHFGPAFVGKAAEGELTFAPALMKIWPWSLAGAVIIVLMDLWRKRAAKQTARDSDAPR